MRAQTATAQNYRCEAMSVTGFIQQVAVGYVARGYWFYVIGTIPDGKDRRVVDQKLVSRYGIAVSKWGRARRKRSGAASVQYLRLGQVFILAATQGQHPFFEEEGAVISDIRRVPLKFAGYSISFSQSGSNGHVSVRIEREQYTRLKKHLESIALRPSADIIQWLRALPFEPYAPIRQQLDTLLRSVNRLRKAASLETVPHGALRRLRIPVKVFEPARTTDKTRAGAK